MKRLSITSILLLTLLVIASCGRSCDSLDADAQHNHEQPANQPTASQILDRLEFFSLEEFLYAYRAVRGGSAEGELARVAKSVDFASLEELHLITGIPESYHLTSILIFDELISIRFLPEEYLVSDETIHGSRFSWPYFHFQYNRWTWELLESWGVEDPLDGIMRSDGVRGFADGDHLINGRYFHERGTIHWAQDSKRFSLRLPNPPRDSRDSSALGAGIIGFEGNTVHDLLPFTELTTINLLDDALVAELIGETYQLNIDLGYASGSRGNLAAFHDALPIGIPANASIHNFITTNHSEFPIERPFIECYTFLGWYLDADFATPLSRIVSFMPPHDTTLYARWRPNQP
ncbi:MAG: InlB B-repeat-containing protein [Defluviitaleaceae bacterium]|nr:InlB B-repeat-containing protein [Defluviitaleaceae bacterium]